LENQKCAYSTTFFTAQENIYGKRTLEAQAAAVSQFN
jgi:hypothetical protein